MRCLCICELDVSVVVTVSGWPLSFYFYDWTRSEFVAIEVGEVLEGNTQWFHYAAVVFASGWHCLLSWDVLCSCVTYLQVATPLYVGTSCVYVLVKLTNNTVFVL